MRVVKLLVIAENAAVALVLLLIASAVNTMSAIVETADAIANNMHAVANFCRWMKAVIFIIGILGARETRAKIPDAEMDDVE
jgi:hypothetical protein